MSLNQKALEAAAYAVFAKANEPLLLSEKIKGLWPSQHRPHWDGFAEAAITAYLTHAGESVSEPAQPADAVRAEDWENAAHVFLWKNGQYELFDELSSLAKSEAKFRAALASQEAAR